MRAAEILAEMLLNEGRVFGIVYGPNIPEEGYWLAGDSLRDMVQKLAVGMGSKETQQTKSFIDTLISSGHELVTSIDGQDARGRPTKNVMVYGLEIPDLSPKAAQILGVQATTPVYHQKQYQDIAPGTPPNTTGREAFGLDMTPQEKQTLAQQKALAKEQSKQKWHNLTPDEEAEFNQWAKASGKTPAGLVSRLGQAAAPAAPAAAPAAPAAAPATPAPAPPAAPRATAPVTATPAATPAGKGPNRAARRAAQRAAGTLGRKP